MKYVPDYKNILSRLQQEIDEKKFKASKILYIHRLKTEAYDNYRPIMLYKLQPSEVCIECEEMTVEKVINELNFHINYYQQF